MLYCRRDHRGLESFMASQGMPRLHYAVEYEGSRVVANLRTGPELVGVARTVEHAPTRLPWSTAPEEDTHV
jgi:hypothetical protein